MKNIWMGLIASLVGLNGISQTSASSKKISIKNLVGKWETADSAGLEIIDSSSIFVTYGKDLKPILSYKADFSKSPCWFGCTVKDTGQKLSAMKSLIWLDNAVLKWQVFEDGERPTNFAADKGEIGILRRKR